MHVSRIAAAATLAATVSFHGCAPRATALAPSLGGSNAQFEATLAPPAPAPMAPPRAASLAEGTM